ncbi:MFS transporter [Novosphingobium sp. FSY-8]|uniref:MFS transporter n=1 Tax=Novosphingobium ovatum TaxID=1908523 RepID=A0ABW9XES3_9SPHN|nr:NnrU family protein [Novosphingobium ovatum]NBC37021.1 MFS transporter [Novosphingobium ovatum]
MLWLIIAALAFVGGHFVLSHPLRACAVGLLGEKGFAGLYSLVAFAAMGAMVVAFRAVGPGGAMLWDGTGPAVWALASGLTLVGITLVLGSLRGNPALPNTPVETVAQARAAGVYAVTRHPMMWGIALWAAAHVLVAPTPRVIVLMGAMAVLALVGAALQDRKKAALMGQAWAAWAARTTYGLKLARLTQVSPMLWGIALLVWLAATYGHIHANHILAGVWRWVL